MEIDPFDILTPIVVAWSILGGGAEENAEKGWTRLQTRRG